MHPLSCDCDLCRGEWEEIPERQVVTICSVCSRVLYEDEWMARGRGNEIIHSGCSDAREATL